MILAAMAKTKSNRAASRYLNVSYIHYKGYAKMYIDKETGKSLFEKHKNQCGKGIPKFLKGQGKEPALIDIIEGRIDPSSFAPEKIKYRLITEGHLDEECGHCKFSERRVTDYKIPLILHFKDKNKQNYIDADVTDPFGTVDQFVGPEGAPSGWTIEQIETRETYKNLMEDVGLTLHDASVYNNFFNIYFSIFFKIFFSNIHVF